MFPMMDPDKMKPMEEDEAVKKMANIGAIMEGAGASFGVFGRLPVQSS